MWSGVAVGVVVAVLLGRGDPELAGGVRLRQRIEAVGLGSGLGQRVGLLQARGVPAVVWPMGVEQMVLVDELTARVNGGAAVAGGGTDPVRGVAVDGLRDRGSSSLFLDRGSAPDHLSGEDRSVGGRRVH